jgi:NADH dehydrogenase [ubiquinone] 1 alpha subcomplex assembly factor 5
MGWPLILQIGPVKKLKLFQHAPQIPCWRSRNARHSGHVGGTKTSQNRDSAAPKYGPIFVLASRCVKIVFVFLLTNGILHDMSDTVPLIFDRQRLAANRARAAHGFAAHDFLHRHIAADLADRLAVQTRDFDKTLILGSNQGIMRAALDATQNVSFMIEADLTASMLPTAQTAPGVVLDEENLPFAEASLDLVLSPWGLHHVNDLPGTLLQIKRALKPNGLFLAALPGSQTLTALRRAFMQAETEICGGAAPHFHPFADLRDLGGLLQRAGFALPVADADRVRVRYRSPLSLLADLRGMGDGNILMQRAKQSLRRDVVMRALQIFTQLTEEAGATPQNTERAAKSVAEFEICYLAGWAPHESQQKPMRPGSARMRLADALGTTETKLEN